MATTVGFTAAASKILPRIVRLHVIAVRWVILGFHVTLLDACRWTYLTQCVTLPSKFTSYKCYAKEATPWPA
jgi:hypothetical protein